ncbi:hypothetical protein [Glutamicibacter nicotianae]|uniref:hypothetical protein n=1 Tax=Glutamicibacter nicotianae TaxID=37929 RepID=UPI000EF8F37E|nr:hypothetical protein [Glutamicibacter nicotianae]
MTLSGRTESIISEQAAAYGHGALTALLKYANLGKNDPGKDKPGGSWNNLNTRVSTALGKNPSSESLIALATKILNDKVTDGNEPKWVFELRASFLEDGYSLSFSSDEWSIVPVGADEIPLEPQLSQLQADLKARGFTVPMNHHKQAFSAFTRQNWEACNAATRSTMEGFLLEVATAKLGFTPGGGGAAIHALDAANYFEPGEHDYLKGLWKMSHTNGSHPGLSSEQEALFRFSAVTSALTFFIHRWKP